MKLIPCDFGGEGKQALPEYAGIVPRSNEDNSEAGCGDVGSLCTYYRSRKSEKTNLINGWNFVLLHAGWHLSLETAIHNLSGFVVCMLYIKEVGWLSCGITPPDYGSNVAKFGEKHTTLRREKMDELSARNLLLRHSAHMQLL
jgi:hypothetical protein